MSKFFAQIGMDLLNFLISVPYFIRSIYTTPVLRIYANMAVKSTVVDETVKKYANEAIKNIAGPYNIQQVIAIHQKINESFEYTGGVAFEDFRSARKQILNGMQGDCDDFAVLMMALIIAIGGSARIILNLGKESGHAYTEVYIGDKNNLDTVSNYIYEYIKVTSNQSLAVDTEMTIYVHKDNNNNYWIPVDAESFIGAKPNLYPSTIEFTVYSNGRFEEIYKS